MKQLGIGWAALRSETLALPKTGISCMDRSRRELDPAFILWGPFVLSLSSRILHGDYTSETHAHCRGLKSGGFTIACDLGYIQWGVSNIPGMFVLRYWLISY